MIKELDKYENVEIGVLREKLNELIRDYNKKVGIEDGD